MNLNQKTLVYGFIFSSLLLGYNNCSSPFEGTKINSEIAASLSAPEIEVDPQFPNLINSNAISSSFKVASVSQITKIDCSITEPNSTQIRTTVDCSQFLLSFNNLTEDGDYTIIISASSVAGPIGILKKIIKRDSVAPQILINNPPGDSLGSGDIKILFSILENGSGLKSATCQIDNNPKEDCQNSYSAKNLTAGIHQIKVNATDWALNTSEVIIKWNIDLSLPMVTLTKVPLTFEKNNIAQFDFSSATPGLFECQIDGGPFTSCSANNATSGTMTYSNFDLNSRHEFGVRLKSASTGTLSPLTIYKWTIDNIPPSLPIISSNFKSFSNVNTGEITFSATDTNGIKSYECSKDNKTFSTCISPKSETFAEGIQAYTVRALDFAGNTSRDVIVLNIDLTPPSIQWVKQPNIISTSTISVFEFTASDSGSGLENIKCSLNNTAFTACVSPYNLNTPSGSYILKIQSVDKAGNISTMLSHSWTVQTPSPPTEPPSPDPTPLPAGTPGLTQALKMADFILSLQDSGGAIKDSPGGTVCNEDSNLEYALLGLAAAYNQTKNSKYLMGFEKGLAWLADREEMSDPEWKGSWYYTYACSPPYAHIATSPGDGVTDVRGVDTTSAYFPYLLYIHQQISNSDTLVKKYELHAKAAMDFVIRKNFNSEGLSESSYQLKNGKWSLWKYQYTADQADVYLGFRGASNLYDGADKYYGKYADSLSQKIPLVFFDKSKGRFAEGREDGVLSFSNDFNAIFPQGYVAWVFGSTRSPEVTAAYNWLKSGVQPDGSIVGFSGDPAFSLSVANYIMAANELGQLTPTSSLDFLINKAFDPKLGGVVDAKNDNTQYSNVTAFSIIALLKQAPLKW